MKKAALHSLGCKVNSYETEVMRQALEEKGYQIVPFEETADVYIVNTCTVTNIADRKSRQMLHRARQRNPEAMVAAVGCYVQTGREALEDDCIDLAVGNDRKKEIADILEEYLRKHPRVPRDGAHENNGGPKSGGVPENDDRPEGSVPEKPADRMYIPDMNRVCVYEEMQLKHMGEHTRAYIKIQDGCNQFCSYCIIPYARGRVRSRRMEDILQEIGELAEKGCQEVVLTGIHISSYGIDFEESAWKEGRSERILHGERQQYTGGSKLVDLVERIHETGGIQRIRLGSLEPRIITEESAERLSRMPKVCPHFHLSLQSGCDDTLKRMNRHYSAGEYYDCVEILRRCFDHPAITTDVIVGFPGETEEEFRRTKEFLEKVCFYEIHVFKYSRREGTAAASMPGQVPAQVKTRRSAELLELELRQSREFRRRYIGREAEVLPEETREIDGRIYRIGHTKDYVKIAVEAGADGNPKDEPAGNTMVKAAVKGFLTDEIMAGESILR